MEPQDLADAVLAILDASLAGGMDPDVKSFSFDISDAGDVAVKSTSGAGKVYEGTVTAAQIAETLDADMAEDAAAAPAAEAPAAVPPGGAA